MNFILIDSYCDKVKLIYKLKIMIRVFCYFVSFFYSYFLGFYEIFIIICFCCKYLCDIVGFKYFWINIFFNVKYVNFILLGFKYCV